MAQYRYLAVDARTRSILAELPLENVTYGATLNQAGVFRAEMPLNFREQTAPGVWRSAAADLLSATTPGRTEIWVERDGVPVEVYMIWGRDYDSTTTMVPLDGAQIWSYWQRRAIDQTVAAANTELLSAVRTLIQTAAVATGGDIGLTYGSEVSTQLLTRTWLPTDGKMIGAAVEELAALPTGQGFDFRVAPSYVANIPTLTLQLGYPNLGRTAGVSGLIWEMGDNILSYRYPESAGAMASRVIGLGQGDGSTQLYSIQSGGNSVAAGWPVLDAIQGWKDNGQQGTLDGLALAAATAQGSLVSIPDLVVSGSAVPQIGSYLCGDQATFVFGTSPDYFDPRFPVPTSFTARIVGWEATPGNEGQETVRLILN